MIKEMNQKINIPISVTYLSIGMLTTSKWLIGIGVVSGISATFIHVEKIINKVSSLEKQEGCGEKYVLHNLVNN